jgi:hypothetical protein
MMLTLGCAFALSAPAFAGEHVPISDLPGPVRQTVEKETKGATITDIERDTKHGQRIYEVEYVKRGEPWELHISPTGAVLGRHRD